MKILTRDQILQVDDLKYEEVEIPEWGEGCGVRVRTMTAVERDQLVNAAFADGERNAENFRARLCALCVVDEAGKNLFSFNDARALGRKSTISMERIAEVALRLSGLGVVALEDTKKNYSDSPSDVSVSVSA